MSDENKDNLNLKGMNTKTVFMSGDPIFDEVAEVFDKEQAAHKLKTWVAERIVSLFVRTNITMWAVILICAGIEYAFILPHAISDKDIKLLDTRLITKEVIMTLIGATVVQLGAFSLIIARNIFPTVKEP